VHDGRVDLRGYHGASPEAVCVCQMLLTGSAGVLAEVAIGVRAVIVMVSNQTGVEVGYMAGQYPGSIGHLYSPTAQKGPYYFLPYALDNGAWPAFKNKRDWSVEEWRELIKWAQWSGQPPLWSLVPDVVGDRTGTMERWLEYVGEVRAAGFRPAFAIQDGMTFADVPDSECVLFLGGSTDPTDENPDKGGWKEAAIDPWCRAFPGRVHVGRVNTWDRLVMCWRAGAISIDGTGWYHHRQRADLRKFLKETNGGKRAA